ncbi:DUF2357 domain-containing protein [Halanaerobiaceae bacterium Z-7014]|uniref:DUF2357 domain-containing protein n=1 Tax=Halonatronomonas betaini TaxID=2778430 RepID=A0A931F6Z1_9FIRM|nr:restriction endonuclease-like protein [Halonatronomonas betaini]MBF8436091.1 DUF2357 domain-containing protein [Halonatronomonas betaini]
MSEKLKKKELIQIETDAFLMTIKGKPAHPKAGILEPANIDQKARVDLSLYALDHGQVTLKYYERQEDQLIKADSESIVINPVFFEYQDYDIYIESKIENQLNNQIEFDHINREIREAVTPPTKTSKNLFGSINFNSDIGLSDLILKNNGKTIASLTIEVFPSKIDYQEDYQQLIREVNEEVYNLAYDFLKKTYQEMRPKESDSATDSEFYTILRTIFNDLLKAFNRIKAYPHHRLVKEEKVKPASKVKDFNRQSIKWINKNSQHYDRELELPRKLLTVEKRTSFNTFENKFIRWIFNQLNKRLNRFSDRYNSMQRETDERLLTELKSMQRKLEYNLKHSFLAGIGELNKLDSITLVLQMAPGYRELYKYYLMLLKGLSLQGKVFELSLKELWELYEYWSYLKLNRLIRENDKYDMIKHNLIDLDYSGINVTLSKGNQAEVHYENIKTGEKFTLSYNKMVASSLTTGQKPDNVLTLNKENSDVEYHFVFDAKYRLNPGNGGKDNSIPGPEEATINTMHRYRDAIISELKSNNSSSDSHDMSEPTRAVVGAYVLFPYNDEEKYKDHQFYKSIDKINVGAFPFLPNHTELVSEFLEELIEESALTNYERNLLPAGTDRYQQETDFKDNVIIGSLSGYNLDENQTGRLLEHCLEENVFYIKYNQAILSKNLEYIGFYQSAKKFPESAGLHYYGKIKEIDVKSGSDIFLAPGSKSDSNKSSNNSYEKNLFTADTYTSSHSSGDAPEGLYLAFKVEEWNQLNPPIKAEGYGIIGNYIYTNDMLLQRAKTLPELSIKSLEEWRIWLELKRLKEEIKVHLKTKGIDNINKETSITGFSNQSFKIHIENDNLIITDPDNDRLIFECTILEFIANPRRVFNQIY